MLDQIQTHPDVSRSSIDRRDKYVAVSALNGNTADRLSHSILPPLELYFVIMGKKRHTAKTGDKGLHKSTQRSNINDTVNIGDNDNDSDNKDPLYNEVDRFHNEKDKDFLKLDQQDNGDDDDSEGDDVQEDAVMDLGLGDAYSEDDEGDDDDDSSDDDNDMGTKNDEEEDDDDDEEEAMPFSPSDDEEEEMEDNIRDWGRKKSAYYSGDNTADLEIGQDGDDDGDDALLEEEAAKQVQAARFQSMTEDDFLLSDQEQDDDDDTARQGIASGVIDSTGKGLITSSRDVAKLSNRDKQKLLDKQHPEFLPLLSHFTAIAKDLRAKTRVATKAVFFGEAETATVRVELAPCIAS